MYWVDHFVPLASTHKVSNTHPMIGIFGGKWETGNGEATFGTLESKLECVLERNQLDCENGISFGNSENGNN